MSNFDFLNLLNSLSRFLVSSTISPSNHYGEFCFTRLSFLPVTGFELGSKISKEIFSITHGKKGRIL